MDSFSKPNRREHYKLYSSDTAQPMWDVYKLVLRASGFTTEWRFIKRIPK